MPSKTDTVRQTAGSNVDAPTHFWVWLTQMFCKQDTKAKLTINFRNCNKYTTFQKSVPSLTCYNLDIHDPITTIFGNCHRESKRSDDALFSHLTYLVLLHYLAKEETNDTAHWCTVHATQSNCCNALNFLSPEPCTPIVPIVPIAECIDHTT